MRLLSDSKLPIYITFQRQLQAEAAEQRAKRFQQVCVRIATRVFRVSPGHHWPIER
jgi:hypothetical protein